MAEPVILREEPIEGFIRDGFKGMRRHAINQFARKFFITEDNPSGTIDPFPEDMEKEKLDALMNLYMGQGKFGTDPFNLRPQDEVAEMKKQIAELQAALQGPRPNPATVPYKPPTWQNHKGKIADPIREVLPVLQPDKQDVAHEDMEWRDIVAKAKGMGLKPFHKSRAVVISEIEAKEAE